MSERHNFRQCRFSPTYFAVATDHITPVIPTTSISVWRSIKPVVLGAIPDRAGRWLWSGATAFQRVMKHSRRSAASRVGAGRRRKHSSRAIGKESATSRAIGKAVGRNLSRTPFDKLRTSGEWVMPVRNEQTFERPLRACAAGGSGLPVPRWQPDARRWRKSVRD